jgi:S-formylglutathione hydrolase FrmB
MPSPFPNLSQGQRGAVHAIDHHSVVLQGNPWGDPHQRDLFVYTPPGYEGSEDRFPVIMVLPGYTGTGEKLLARGFTDVSIATRIDRLIAQGCPPFIAVMPDCMTTLGGSQYVDSVGLGSYATYLAKEIRQAVDDGFRTTGRWGITGHSSGGFGALHLAMSFPGTFSAVASHAGDLGFDLAYLSDITKAVVAVNRVGDVASFVDEFWSKRQHSSEDISALMLLCISCAYAPDLNAEPIPCRMPVDFATGAVDFEVVQSWRAMDPIVRLDDTMQADALRALDLLFIDAGRFDEYNLQLAARRFVRKLRELEIPHMHEEFDGGHRGMAWRYGVSMAYLAEALRT